MESLGGLRLPLLVFLEHSTALSTWMSRGLSSAEAEVKNSASAETIDVARMVCVVCVCIEGMDTSSNGLSSQPKGHESMTSV